MTENGIFQLAFYLLILLLLVKPLGWYMAQVYEGKPCGLSKIGRPLEQLLYRFSGVNPTQDMDWKKYLTAMLVFNFFGLFVVYVIQRIQIYLPLNPQHLTN